LTLLRYQRWLQREGSELIRAPAAAGAPRRIVMLISSNLHNDPRVQREAVVLARNGFPVTIVCPSWAPTVAGCGWLDWGPDIDFRILPQSAGRFVLHFPHLLGRRMLAAALAEDAWAYHAHDLDMALIAMVAAARKRVACVCDFHEWYSENVTFSKRRQRYRPHPPLKRWVYRAVERLALHTANEVVTVCESIARCLEEAYEAPRTVHVIRNIPDADGSGSPAVPSDLRQMLGLTHRHFLVLYQGGLGPSRNLEPVIGALQHAPDAVLVLRGPGHETYSRHYFKLAERLRVRDRFFCLPPVPSTQVVAEARSADAGLWTLLANVGLNFKFALPNKVFEYMAAGLPLLAADLPEVSRIARGYEVGLCFDPESPASIAAAINRLAADKQLQLTFRGNLARALTDLDAGREWGKLVDIYRGLARAE
jgi:glycosyltransferase involved in cell wall biosynthesis